MHRLAAVPGSSSPSDGVLFIEQPAATAVLLTSADTDLTALAAQLDRCPDVIGAGRSLRALNLAALQHPAVLDHYIRTSLQSTDLVVVRLLGGRGHWSYGLEQLRQWAEEQPARQLMVLSGTAEEEATLVELSSVSTPVALACSRCLREGGPANWLAVLTSWKALLDGAQITPPVPEALADPEVYDWRDDPGPRVGVVLYRALLQAGDLALADALLSALRTAGLAPRALWLSSLRDGAVQQGVADLLGRERVDAVLCTTSFASV